jgi:hypothetical protein
MEHLLDVNTTTARSDASLVTWSIDSWLVIGRF